MLKHLPLMTPAPPLIWLGGPVRPLLLGETSEVEFVNDRIGLMTRWFGIPPIKLRPVAHQRPERRPSCIRSFPHGRRTVELGWKENSFRIRVEQDLLRIEAVNTRQILSRHRVRIAAALANICDRNPAVPDVFGVFRKKSKR